jgi:plasmid maintenance system antidote protein VapI
MRNLHPRTIHRPHWKVYVSYKLKDPQGDGGALFDDLLKQNSLTRHGLAQGLGLSHTTIANVRFGRKPCTLDTASKIAAVLGVRTSLLFVETSSRVAVQPSSDDGRRAA